MCHMRTIAILNVRKSIFWPLRLYFWTNAPHIRDIDASGNLQKLWRDKLSVFFICAGVKSVQLRQRVFLQYIPY